MLDYDRTAALLRTHEAVRFEVYDDATGKPLRPGMTLQGWPTIGVGRNLADPGLTTTEIATLLQNDITSRHHALVAALPWVGDLDAVRTAALVDMAFMGVSKLLKFTPTLEAIRDRRYPYAATRIRATKWFRDVGATRGEHVCSMFESGEWPRP